VVKVSVGFAGLKVVEVTAMANEEPFTVIWTEPDVVAR
jgi:hypothetical protein